MTHTYEQRRWTKSFELSLLAMICFDPLFLRQHSGIVRPEYFGHPIAQDCCRLALDHLAKYEKGPTPEEFEQALTDLVQGDKRKKEQQQAYSEFYDAMLDTEPHEYKESLLERARTHARQQACLIAAQQAQDLLIRGEVDGLDTLFSKALQVGSLDKEEYIDWQRDVVEQSQQNSRAKLAVPTGVWLLDQVIHGLAPGETGAVLGVPNRGKTLVLVNFASHSYRIGRNVIHIMLEGTAPYVSLRYAGCLLSLMKGDRQEFDQKLQAFVQRSITGDQKLIIKRMRLGSKVSQVRAFVERALERYVNTKLPTTLIVDYGQLVHPDDGFGSLKTHERQQAAYQGLSGIAFDTKCPMWTAAQINREGAKKEREDSDEENLLGNHDIAGVYDAIGDLDATLTLNQTREEFLAGIIRLFVSKMKEGRSQDVVECGVNYTLQQLVPVGLQGSTAGPSKKVTGRRVDRAYNPPEQQLDAAIQQHRQRGRR